MSKRRVSQSIDPYSRTEEVLFFRRVKHRIKDIIDDIVDERVAAKEFNDVFFIDWKKVNSDLDLNLQVHSELRDVYEIILVHGCIFSCLAMSGTFPLYMPCKVSLIERLHFIEYPIQWSCSVLNREALLYRIPDLVGVWCFQ